MRAANRDIERFRKKFELKYKAVAKKQAKTVQDFFKRSFKNQGFTDERLMPWKPRKRSKNSPILIQTGALRRSIKIIEILGSKRIKRYRIQSDAPYGAFHNAGTEHIPQRQFMGVSKRLNRLVELSIAREMRK